jgi:hypothetical protein
VQIVGVGKVLQRGEWWLLIHPSDYVPMFPRTAPQLFELVQVELMHAPRDSCGAQPVPIFRCLATHAICDGGAALNGDTRLVPVDQPRAILTHNDVRDVNVGSSPDRCSYDAANASNVASPASFTTIAQ